MMVYVQLQGLNSQSVTTVLDKYVKDSAETLGPFENDVPISKKYWSKILESPTEELTGAWYFKDLKFAGMITPRAMVTITWFEQFEVALSFEFFDISVVGSTSDNLIALGRELMVEVESEAVTIGIDRAAQHSVLFANGSVSLLTAEFVHWDELRARIQSRF